MHLPGEIFDSLSAPTFIVNSSGKVIYCNEPASLLSGISIRRICKAESIDKVFQFNPPVPEVGEKLAEITEPTPYKEVSFESSAGESGKIQITVQPFNEIDGQPTWLIYFRDVTLEETLQKKYRAELDQKEEVIDELRKARAALEDYSKNLEKMVEERTHELKELNKTLSALLDSLGQGFFIFDKTGTCLPIYSKATLEMLGGSPAAKPLWEVLHIAENKTEGMKKWLTTLYAEMLPFEDLTPLAPQNLPNTAGRYIDLSYYPIRSENGELEFTVVMASDNTAEVEAKQQAEFERARAQMVLKLVQNKSHTQAFIRETISLLGELNQILGSDPEQLDKTHLFRVLHTIKGGTASYSLNHIRDLCHQAESLLMEYNPENKNKVEFWQRIHQLSAQIEDSFNEFLSQNKEIIGDSEEYQERQITLSASRVNELIAGLEIFGADKAQEFLRKELLFEPIENHLKSYNKVIQRIANEAGKKIHPLEIINGDLPILPEAYETLLASLVHGFQNAADHGIETPELREASGKTSHGKIQVSCQILETKTQGSLLQIIIADDGHGIDVIKLRKKLEEKGIETQGKSDQEILQYIFDSGLSTRDQVTETSGRGVGMDAILAASKRLGGTARVESESGKGTKTIIEVPYFKSLQPRFQAAS